MQVRLLLHMDQLAQSLLLLWFPCLDAQQLNIHGHMLAIMTLMESQSIIIGLLLISIYNKEESNTIKKAAIIKHSFTNGNV